MLAGARRHDRQIAFRRWAARASVALLCLFVLYSLYRFAGENERRDTDRRNFQAAVARFAAADCDLDQQLANLPAEVVKRGRPVDPVLASLATAARTAYVNKECSAAVNPKTGKPFGPPPPEYKTSAR